MRSNELNIVCMQYLACALMGGMRRRKGLAHAHTHACTFVGRKGGQSLHVRHRSTEHTASLQSIAERNSRSKRLSSIRLTPPTLANNGLGEKASQNAFDKIVMDAIINL